MAAEILLEVPTLSPFIHEFINRADWLPAIKQAWQQVVPGSILLTPRPPSLTIRLDAPQLLSQAALAAMTSALQKAWSADPVPQIIWDVHYPPAVVTPLIYLENHWPDLLKIFLGLQHHYITSLGQGVVNRKPSKPQQVQLC